MWERYKLRELDSRIKEVKSSYQNEVKFLTSGLTKRVYIPSTVSIAHEWDGLFSELTKETIVVNAAADIVLVAKSEKQSKVGALRHLRIVTTAILKNKNKGKIS